MEQARRGVRVVLGSMTFAKQTDIDAARKIVGLFVDKERACVCESVPITVEIDTAFMYEDGKSEEMLGELLQEQQKPTVWQSLHYF